MRAISRDCFVRFEELITNCTQLIPPNARREGAFKVNISYFSSFSRPETRLFRYVVIKFFFQRNEQQTKLLAVSRIQFFITFLLKKFPEKKGTPPLRWVLSPGPFYCRSNALSYELRRFDTTFLTQSIYASCVLILRLCYGCSVCTLLENCYMIKGIT